MFNHYSTFAPAIARDKLGKITLKLTWYGLPARVFHAILGCFGRSLHRALAFFRKIKMAAGEAAWRGEK
jgi:hypothetical protein